MGQQLYSIVNWDAEDDGQPSKFRSYRRRGGGGRWRDGGNALAGPSSNRSTKQLQPLMGLRNRVAQAAAQVSRVASRLSVALQEKPGAAVTTAGGEGAADAAAAAATAAADEKKTAAVAAGALGSGISSSNSKSGFRDGEM